MAAYGCLYFYNKKKEENLNEWLSLVKDKIDKTDNLTEHDETSEDGLGLWEKLDKIHKQKLRQR